MIVTLVGCAKSKLDRPAPARELYTSRQFVAAMDLAAEMGHAVRILSALHGVLEPETTVEPYDTTTIGPGWGARATEQLDDLRASWLVVLAGSRYTRTLIRSSFKIWAPLSGLGSGARFAETREMLARLLKARGQVGLFACSRCRRSHPCWHQACLACGCREGMVRLPTGLIPNARTTSEDDE